MQNFGPITQVQIALVQPAAGARLKLHASHGRARDDAVKLHVSRVRGMHGQCTPVKFEIVIWLDRKLEDRTSFFFLNES